MNKFLPTKKRVNRAFSSLKYSLKNSRKSSFKFKRRLVKIRLSYRKVKPHAGQFLSRLASRILAEVFGSWFGW